MLAIQNTSFKNALVFVALITLSLVGCATDTTEVPVESAAETSGIETGAGADGSALSARQTELLAQRRIYFPFDASTIDEESREIIAAHAAYLAANPQVRVHLEGHCDERGTREYNLALGERRAQAVERVMRLLGVSGSRATTVSYGEERPLAPEHNESAWRLNRRVEIIYK